MAKIDIEKLREMVDQGKSQKEIAEFFSCSSAAVCKQLKKLKISVIRNAAAEHAPVVVAKKLKQIEQLEKINQDANELLDLCMAWQRGDEEALRILESQVRYVMVGKGDDKEAVKQFKFKDPRDLALRAMAEIRNQLNLQLEIAKTLYDAEIVRDFMREICNLLGETDAALRDQFIEKVRKRAPLNFAVSTL